MGIDTIKLHHSAAGTLYHPDVRTWPETSTYRYQSGEHDLVLFLAEPTEAEIQAARTGQAEFALLFQDGVIMLCHRFEGGLPWSDSAFTQWMIPSNERQLPPVLRGAERALIWVSLVDASTGILLTLRVTSLSPDFTAALHEAIRRQARTAFRGEADYEKRKAQIRRRYPTTDPLVAAATAHCTGGSDDLPNPGREATKPLAWLPKKNVNDAAITEMTNRAIYANYPTLGPPPAEFSIEEFEAFDKGCRILLVNGDDDPDEGPINIAECLAGGAIKAVAVKIGSTDQRLYMVQPGHYSSSLGFRHPGR